VAQITWLKLQDNFLIDVTDAEQISLRKAYDSNINERYDVSAAIVFEMKNGRSYTLQYFSDEEALAAFNALWDML
jgi:hypothetical protein